MGGRDFDNCFMDHIYKLICKQEGADFKGDDQFFGQLRKLVTFAKIQLSESEDYTFSMDLPDGKKKNFDTCYYSLFLKSFVKFLCYFQETNSSATFHEKNLKTFALPCSQSRWTTSRNFSAIRN